MRHYDAKDSNINGNVKFRYLLSAENIVISDCYQPDIRDNASNSIRP